MGNISETNHVKLFCGILFSDESQLRYIVKNLEDKYGKIDFTSNDMPFIYTDYYKKEMGDNLIRKFVSFKNLIEPCRLSLIKQYTNMLEKQTCKQNMRTINIDPGYLDMAKVVLASTKDYTHRLYLGNGIYGEVTLHYKNCSYAFWPWTYPDYKTKEYLVFFEKVREKYKKVLSSQEKDQHENRIYQFR
ncbi:DUF4416 family protein [bacterium]